MGEVAVKRIEREMKEHDEGCNDKIEKSNRRVENHSLFHLDNY